MNADEPKPIVLGPGEGQPLWHLGALMNFKATSEQTAGRFGAVEGHADKQMAVPLHSHANDDEIWFVADGQIVFRAGDEEFTRGAGSFVWIPRGVAHTFRIESATARWFGIGLPGGLDHWFFETGVPAGALTLPPPPPGPPSDADIEAIVKSLQAYGTETLGPPM